MFHMCPLCGLCVLFCSWALITVRTSIGEIHPQTGWLWGLSVTTVEELLYRVWHYRVGFTLAGPWFLLSLLFECVICGGDLVWSKAGHQVNWSWVLLGGEGQGQALTVPWQGPPNMSCNMIGRWLLLVLDLGLLSNKYGMLRSDAAYFCVCEPLRDFRRVCNHWKQLGWAVVSGNHQGRERITSLVDGEKHDYNRVFRSTKSRRLGISYKGNFSIYIIDYNFFPSS